MIDELTAHSFQRATVQGVQGLEEQLTSAIVHDDGFLTSHIANRDIDYWRSLATTPPSPLWADFGRLSEKTLTARPSTETLERWVELDARGIHEVQEGIARLVASAAANLPAARELCLRGLFRKVYVLRSRGSVEHETLILFPPGV